MRDHTKRQDCLATLAISSLTVPEDQFSRLVSSVAAHVLLQVGVLVVIDAHALVAGAAGQPRDQTRLAHRRLALQQNWVRPEKHNL